MKGIKIGVLCASLLIGMFSVASCGKTEEKGSVRYLNFKPEVADVWEEVAQIYTEETGVEVEILNAPSNCNEQTLKSEIAKRNAPTLFQVNGPVGYGKLEYYCEDLSDTDLYSWVVDKDMVIKGDDGGVYGIPYVVEGYGIIYNKAIMDKYFSLGTKSTSYSSMDEINNFNALKEVSEDMQAHKSELGIKGVFASTSFATGEEWRWQTHLMNLPIYYEYIDNNVSDMNEIQFTYGENYKNLFDLYINNSTCAKSELGNKTVNDSMAEFAKGECAMVQNGNWAWGQISETEGNVVTEDNCKYMPMYTGVAGEESQGLCIGTECYICVNSMVSEADKQASIDFLEWLFSSDVGKDYVTNKFQFITVFNTFSTEETPSNPLAREVSTYVNDTSKSSVSWNFTTFPSQEYKDNLSNHLYKYINGEESFDDVSKYIVSEWNLEKAGIAGETQEDGAQDEATQDEADSADDEVTQDETDTVEDEATQDEADTQEDVQDNAEAE